jgi:Zn-dependent M28 family amino/carboxypeptidase
MVNIMTRNISWLTLILIFIISILYSCTSSDEKAKQIKKDETAIIIPFFNADSAYYFVKKQTDFGARVPGTKAHAECAAWLADKLKSATPHVKVQDFKTRVYSGEVYNGKNVIASFNPESKARIMLCSHWDSRPFADHDPDPAKRNEPVMGANDGASGVGVLLELARILKENSPKIGVDIIFFDLEDYGPPQDSQNEAANEHWGLGSQYWSGNPHVSDYRARFVILLDMVGAKGAKFRKEGFSMYFAPDKVKKVWDIAAGLGYRDYFPDEKGGYINDDHYFINEILKVPAIDIIHLDENSSNGSFFEYWHTTSDTFDKIDKETLRVVGEVVTKVVFAEK